jgi:hypothetical protein
MNFNMLCAMNIISGEISILSRIPRYSIKKQRLGAKIVAYGEDLYLSPMSADDIWKYNIMTSEWKCFERSKLEKDICSGEMFQAVLYDNKIFFIGSLYPAIIVFDLKTEKLEYITEPYEDRIALCKEKKDCLFRSDYVLNKNMLLIASCISNEVFEFNLDTYEYRYIRIGDKEFTYSGIGYDGNYFYLSPRKHGPIVVFKEPDDYKIIDVHFSKTEGEEDLPVLGGVLCDEREIIFYARFTDSSIRMAEDLNPICFKAQYLFYKHIDEITTVSLQRDGELFIRYCDREFHYKTCIDDKYFSAFFTKCYREDGEQMDEITYESENLNLSMFLSVV